MRPVSEAFKAAVVSSHQIATRFDVLQDGIAIDTLDTVTAGSVTLDAKAAARGRMDLTIVDDGTLGLVPTQAGDLLAPYGREIRVWRGVTYPDELVSLGVFRIDDVAPSEEAGSLTLAIAGLDRSGRISDARFEHPDQCNAGTNLATAILGLIQPVYPDVVYDFTPTSVVTPLIIFQEQDDRWAIAQKLASDAGLRLYFDGDGTLVLAADSPSDAVITLAEGTAGVLLSAAKRWTRQGVYNRWIATGQSTGVGAPVRGVATDDNPLSPTYYFGQFGPVPTFFSSQFITTDAQAADAAAAMKSRQIGTAQAISFGSLMLPHLEPGDVARITRLRLGIDEDNVIDSLVIGLTHDARMTGTTRALPVAS